MTKCKAHGWQLVPIEPTQEMFLSAERAGVSFATQQKCWEAMLGSAPAPSQSDVYVMEKVRKAFEEIREHCANGGIEIGTVGERVAERCDDVAKDAITAIAAALRAKAEAE
jgi:hypothetical protein